MHLSYGHEGHVRALNTTDLDAPPPPGQAGQPTGGGVINIPCRRVRVTNGVYGAWRFLASTVLLLLVLLRHAHPTRVAVLRLGARETRRDLREEGEREVSGR